jgi:hypothetical protein
MFDEVFLHRKKFVLWDRKFFTVFAKWREQQPPTDHLVMSMNPSLGARKTSRKTYFRDSKLCSSRANKATNYFAKSIFAALLGSLECRDKAAGKQEACKN